MMNQIPTPWRVFCVLLMASTTPAANPKSERASHEVERVASATPATRATDDWVTVIGADGASGAAALGKNLAECGNVELDDQANHLKAQPGVGVVAAVKKFAYRDDNNLTSVEHFGDCEVTLEFLLGDGANSGVKLQSRYEIQLYDSWDKEELSGDDCGGVYPHWVYGKSGNGIKYVDQGVAPSRNAAKRPGEWQTLRIAFRAPRFNHKGDKIENARFITVVLNGEVVQKDVEMDSPTGNAVDPLPEVASAPLYLQMDHGAVAFRQVRVRPL